MKRLSPGKRRHLLDALAWAKRERVARMGRLSLNWARLVESAHPSSEDINSIWRARA